jgi:hypothetical protein
MIMDEMLWTTAYLFGVLGPWRGPKPVSSRCRRECLRSSGVAPWTRSSAYRSAKSERVSPGCTSDWA